MSNGELASAIIRAANSVGAIGKDAKNEQQRYQYRSIEIIVAKGGSALRAEGVIVVPIATEVVHQETYETKKGGIMHAIRLEVTWSVIGHGETITLQTMGEGADSGDKATQKAHTFAWKTMLVQLLGISEGVDDPDFESPEGRARRGSYQRSNGSNGSANDSANNGTNGSHSTNESANGTNGASQSNPIGDALKRDLVAMREKAKSAGFADQFDQHVKAHLRGKKAHEISNPEEAEKVKAAAQQELDRLVPAAS